MNDSVNMTYFVFENKKQKIIRYIRGWWLETKQGHKHRHLYTYRHVYKYPFIEHYTYMNLTCTIFVTIYVYIYIYEKKMGQIIIKTKFFKVGWTIDDCKTGKKLINFCFLWNDNNRTIISKEEI